MIFATDRNGDTINEGDYVEHYVDLDPGIVRGIREQPYPSGSRIVLTIDWVRGGEGCEHFDDEVSLIPALAYTEAHDEYAAEFKDPA